MIPIKSSRKQFEELYPADEVCLHKIFLLKYGEAKECAKCNKPFKYHKLNNLRLYSCQFCGWNIAPTADTIFHKSPTPLVDWFYIIYLFSISKNGLSTKEIERHLGVTYKCAWRIANRVRYLFDVTGSNLTNIVELDETYVGGKGGNNKRGRGAENKTPVFGMVERKGEIIARVTVDTKRKTVIPLVRENVKVGTQIMTDEYLPYRTLIKEGYKHEMVNHSARKYVRENVHTNTLEGFWSQLKRSLNGTYHMVSPKYLQAYVNEFSYRYNHRFVPRPLFLSLVEKVGRKV